MGCNCANRMRKYVLPLLGYEPDLMRFGWVHKKTGEFIADTEIEAHHTRLTAQLGLKRAKGLFTRFAGGPDVQDETAEGA